MHYLALGDSITFGHSPVTKAAPFPFHVHAAMSEQTRVALQLYAKPGWTFDHPRTDALIGTLFNPFPKWSVMEEVTRLINLSVRRLAKDRKLQVLDLEAVFKGSEHQLIEGFRQGRMLDVRPVGNPIHPNAAGLQAIADEVVRCYHRIAAGRTKQAVEHTGDLVMAT